MLVAVVDTGFANHHSVHKALQTAGGAAGLRVVRTRDPDALATADKIVVPGQGAFADCVDALAGGMGDALLERLAAGVPYLGICLGLQVLFESSEEAPGRKGLSVLRGGVRALERAPGLKIPHLGWNQLEAGAATHPALDGCGALGDWFYFVHSYHAVPDDPNVVLATVGYGPNRVTAAVAKDNVLATQFHPEKSQAAGLELLKVFLEL
jgi:glutamine amidotransferase